MSLFWMQRGLSIVETKRVDSGELCSPPLTSQIRSPKHSGLGNVDGGVPGLRRPPTPPSFGPVAPSPKTPLFHLRLSWWRNSTGKHLLSPYPPLQEENTAEPHGCQLGHVAIWLTKNSIGRDTVLVVRKALHNIDGFWQPSYTPALILVRACPG